LPEREKYRVACTLQELPGGVKEEADACGVIEPYGNYFTYFKEAFSISRYLRAVCSWDPWVSLHPKGS